MSTPRPEPVTIDDFFHSIRHMRTKASLAPESKDKRIRIAAKTRTFIERIGALARPDHKKLQILGAGPIFDRHQQTTLHTSVAHFG